MDAKSIMSNAGSALMGIGRASGDNRAQKAAPNKQLKVQWLEVSIDGARGVLFNVAGGYDMSMSKFKKLPKLLLVQSLLMLTLFLVQL